MRSLSFFSGENSEEDISVCYLVVPPFFSEVGEAGLSLFTQQGTTRTGPEVRTLCDRKMGPGGPFLALRCWL